MLWQPAFSQEQVVVRSIDRGFEAHPYFARVRRGLPADFRESAIRQAIAALQAGTADDFIEAADAHYERQINWD